MVTAAVVGNDIVAYYIAERLVKFGRDVILVHPSADPEHPLLKGLPFLTIDPKFTGTVDEAVLLTGSPTPFKCNGRAVLITPHPYKPEHIDKETGKVKEDTVPITMAERAVVASLPDWCILRTGELYGNGIEGSVTNFATRALQGSAIVVYPKVKNYLMVFNLTELIVDALTKPEAKNQIINVADGKATSEQGLASAMNVLCNSGDYKTARSQVILRPEGESTIDMDLTKMEKIFGGATYQTVVGLQSVLKFALDTMNNVDEHTRNYLKDQILPMSVK